MQYLPKIANSCNLNININAKIMPKKNKKKRQKKKGKMYAIPSTSRFGCNRFIISTHSYLLHLMTLESAV